MWSPFKFGEVSLIIAHHVWKYFIWKVSRIFSKVSFVPKLIENIPCITTTEREDLVLIYTWNGRGQIRDLIPD